MQTTGPDPEDMVRTTEGPVPRPHRFPSETPMRKALLVTAALLPLGIALPASASTTTTTFTLTAGALTVTAPAAADLGTGAVGSPISASLGNVTVADNRGTLLGSWTASVSSTDFTTGAASANETIGRANVTYWSGAATATTGTAVRVPGQLLAANAVALSESRTAFSATGAVGANTTTWQPTVVVTPPAAAVVGAYTGTITHSVA
jgi:hypothetical protein